MVDLLICYSKYFWIFRFLLRLYKLPNNFCVQFIIIVLLSFNVVFPRVDELTFLLLHNTHELGV